VLLNIAIVDRGHTPLVRGCLPLRYVVFTRRCCVMDDAFLYTKQVVGAKYNGMEERACGREEQDEDLLVQFMYLLE